MSTTKKKQKKSNQFEYCIVCKLNHDQAQQHKYFPNHKTAFSNFLTRFNSKITDVRFFINNPTLLRTEHASLNRFWCVCCEIDIDEIDSSFACENAITHLASADHLKSLKHFFWKHGGGMDRIHAFTIAKADVDKWEKKCRSLKSQDGTLSTTDKGLLIGPSNNIHIENKNENINSFENNGFRSFNLNVYDGIVMPLQNYTNEYQVSFSGHHGSNLGAYNAPSVATLQSVNNMAVNTNSQQSLPGREWLGNGPHGEGKIHQVYQDGKVVVGDSTSRGLHNLTQINARGSQNSKGNVHSGAPPPWLEVSEQNGQLNPRSSISISSSHGSSKSTNKLNPKRVGAAWAERRKMEIELEKRGEVVRTDYDSSWLPNFGRVWQSGSRKESKKEFVAAKPKDVNIEKPKQVNIESHEEMPVKIQPYISKRKFIYVKLCIQWQSQDLRLGGGLYVFYTVNLVERKF
ncbi:hypothetical protein ACFE04_028872 [Oxalis oulophora]